MDAYAFRVVRTCFDCTYMKSWYYRNEVAHPLTHFNRKLPLQISDLRSLMPSQDGVADNFWAKPVNSIGGFDPSIVTEVGLI